MVLTFDREGMGAIVCENHEQLYGVIQRWMEKNAPYIEYISPIEKALTEDPIQAMFCGPIELMQRAQEHLLACDFTAEFTLLRTQYDARNLCILDILNVGCSKGHALERWANYRGIDRSEVMAIGDNYNDIEMLTFAGHPVIMGNAVRRPEAERLDGYSAQRRERRCRSHRAGAGRQCSERECVSLLQLGLLGLAITLPLHAGGDCELAQRIQHPSPAA